MHSDAITRKIDALVDQIGLIRFSDAIDQDVGSQSSPGEGGDSSKALKERKPEQSKELRVLLGDPA